MIGQFVVGIVVCCSRIKVNWKAPPKLSCFKRIVSRSFSGLGGEAHGSVLAEVRVPTERQVHLKTHDGRYVVADGWGGKAVNAKRTQATMLQTFTLIDQNGGKLLSCDPVSLRTFNDTNYLRTKGGGGRVVNATED